MKALKYMMIAAAALCGLAASAQADYDQTRIRAERAFGFGEWASASALYHHMLLQRPQVSESYGRAIVANEMLGDSVQALHLLTQAMGHAIPLDSVLAQVKKYSFVAGRGNMYEQFMLQAARQNQWMARPLEHQLLKYYSFRNDGPMMVRYAEIMLNGAPDDLRFLYTLAKGYMIDGQPEKAVETWKRMLEIDPANYRTLLSLANYYRLEGQTDQARQYFERAAAIRPTPFIEAALSD